MRFMLVNDVLWVILGANGRTFVTVAIAELLAAAPQADDGCGLSNCGADA